MAPTAHASFNLVDEEDAHRQRAPGWQAWPAPLMICVDVSVIAMPGKGLRRGKLHLRNFYERNSKIPFTRRLDSMKVVALIGASC